MRTVLPSRIRNFVAPPKLAQARAAGFLAPTNVGAFPIRVVLHSVWIADKSDSTVWPVPNPTGEFYLYSAASNGEKLVEFSSKDDPNTDNGAWTGIKSHEFLPVRRTQLWPKANTATSPSGRVGLSLVLRERDDGGAAEKAMKGISASALEIGRKAAESKLKGSVDLKDIQKVVGDLADDLIDDAYGDDNIITRYDYGLDFALEQYQCGRFVKLGGRNGTYALCMIVPHRNPDVGDWIFDGDVSLMPGQAKKPLRLAVGAGVSRGLARNAERVVSMVVLNPMRWLMSDARRAAIEINGQRVFCGSARTVTSVAVPPGRDITMKLVDTRFPVHADFLGSVVRPDGAAPHT